MDAVHRALADGRAQQVVHELHHAAPCGASNQGQPERCLPQPSAGDRQREQYLFLVIGRCGQEDRVQRSTGLIPMPIDKRTAPPCRAARAVIDSVPAMA
jgi:hypothetical protein